MATQKPISTISYNTEPFLRERLEAWLKAHIIQAYMYICHKGEDGDKDHIHLRIEPNKKLDPMTLAEELREYVLGEDKPRGCRPFRPSKEEDWILYAVHDEQYLKVKYKGGEKCEKLPYKWQDIRCPELYDMEIAYIRAKSFLDHTTVNMASRIQQGESPTSLVMQGENPYVVNAIVRTLQTSDYQRLASEYTDIKVKLERLTDAIISEGYDILEDDDGNIILNGHDGLEDFC